MLTKSEKFHYRLRDFYYSLRFFRYITKLIGLMRCWSVTKKFVVYLEKREKQREEKRKNGSYPFCHTGKYLPIKLILSFPWQLLLSIRKLQSSKVHAIDPGNVNMLSNYRWSKRGDASLLNKVYPF